MSSFKFTSFFFLLMFVLPYSVVADLHISQGKDNIAGAVVGNMNPSAAEKFILGDGVSTSKEARNGNILGRKMMKRRVLMKEMEKAKEVSSKVLVAVHSVGNSCSHKRKQNLSTDCKPSGRITGDRHAARKLKMNSFMALNSDYHPPKSHAPKNN